MQGRPKKISKPQRVGRNIKVSINQEQVSTPTWMFLEFYITLDPGSTKFILLDQILRLLSLPLSGD